MHMDNHLKPKLATHFTHISCYLHRQISTLKYFEYLYCNETIQNISYFLWLMSQCQRHEEAQQSFLTKLYLSINLKTKAIYSSSFINNYTKLCITNFFVNCLCHFGWKTCKIYLCILGDVYEASFFFKCHTFISSSKRNTSKCKHLTNINLGLQLQPIVCTLFISEIVNYLLYVLRLVNMEMLMLLIKW